ncbi:MAG: 4-(cytidine 5'-diphospho)-2-C-methyl-D-erythritol kinase [Clostridiales bacterium]|nr:4-(cytidine 5'-diphospho)-2-C-methyl-D-erythritol kinase [Clostridiales bacterium]
MKQITLRGYAKINLTLDVTGRRDDGYHLLEMVMQSISVADTIRIQTTTEPGIRVTCNQSLIPCDPSNTAFWAAQLFSRHHAFTDGLSIHIDKQIPIQAGMAGGSADAAAVLVGLNRLLETGDSLDELCKLGLMVGADVPFCIRGGTMLAQGIGEILHPLPSMPDCFLVVCKPSVNVSTGEAYARIDHVPLPIHPNTKAMVQALKQGDLSAIGGYLCNVFEAVLQLPEIDAIQRIMEQHRALGSRMTGSGSAVFGIFQTESDAQNCVSFLQNQYPETFLCRPVSQGVE